MSLFPSPWRHQRPAIKPTYFQRKTVMFRPDFSGEPARHPLAGQSLYFGPRGRPLPATLLSLPAPRILFVTVLARNFYPHGVGSSDAPVLFSVSAVETSCVST